MSPAGGGRIFEHFKLSCGGGLGVALSCPPQFVNTFRSSYFPRQRGTMDTPLIRLPANEGRVVIKYKISQC